MYKKKSEEEKSEINHGVAAALQDINVYSEGFIFPH